ncbi:XK-related protein 7-like [Lycorma delicatula]|uniref:XK-related protein 7-like n=1 Tax=Lycorma delicatula TaxID=130591 RepID=UPI003F50F86E
MGEFAVVKFSAEEMQSRIEGVQHRTDETEENGSPDFNICYILCLVCSVITYMIDVVVHCWLVYLYHLYAQLTNFVLTVVFIILPALVTTAFSLRWYIIDVDEPTIARPPIWKWILRVIILLLQIAPVLRYCDALVYGIRSKKARCADDILHVDGYYRRMLDEDSDAASLRLFHCFLFAAPQAVIQLTALITAVTQKIPHSSLQDFQLLAVGCSLISIAWSIASYNRSVRCARDDKENLTWFGTTLLFLWHLCSAVSRVVALSLLASLYPVWMISVCFVHWIVMSVWLALSNTQTICGSWCEELALSAMLGFAYVLTYISPRDGPTRYTYLAYYLVCFMENTGALVVWCVGVNSLQDPMLYYGVVAGQVCVFILGIILMLLYYRWFHPAAGVSQRHFYYVQKPRGKWVDNMGD